MHIVKKDFIFLLVLFFLPVSVSFAQDRTLDITFDDLTFKMEKDETFKRSMLTDEIRALEGKHIKIRGFMQPAFKRSGIKTFVFVRDNQECCFGPGAALYDCMIVKMKRGTSTTFKVRSFAVEGEFDLKEYEGPDGKTWAIFRLNDASIE